jgi:hypothetical protein
MNTPRLIESINVEAASREEHGFKILPASSVPQYVLNAVAAFPSKSSEGIGGYVRLKENILKAQTLTLNAESLLQLEALDQPFIVIAARDLFIEIAPSRDRAAKISRAGDGFFGSLIGVTGSPGANGTNSGAEDGVSGSAGLTGGTGGEGPSPHLPDLYIFFQRIKTSAGIPSTGGLLRISVEGVAGGKGGTGGPGGIGGSGNRGTAGSSTKYSCSSGPGIGGNGGPAGSGGKGGPGGPGGRGGNVFLVGPENQWEKAGFFEVLQNPGRRGEGGDPGQPGSGGSPGGGGSAPWPCNGRGGGAWGLHANPVNLGIGDPGAEGVRGEKAMINRDNSDLF